MVVTRWLGLAGRLTVEAAVSRWKSFGQRKVGSSVKVPYKAKTPISLGFLLNSCVFEWWALQDSNL